MGVPTLEGSPPKEPGYSALGLLFLRPTASTLEPDQSLPQASQEEGHQGAGFLTLGQSQLSSTSTYQGVSHWLLGEALPWKVTLQLFRSGWGELPPRGVVCRFSSRWGAAQLLPASVVTLCPGQSPFPSRKPHRAPGECYGNSGPACSGAKVRPWHEQCSQM